MNIPAFSIFSAGSEVFVTIIVLYAVIGNLRGRPLRWKLLGVCLLFELCVNIMYMVHRAAAADTATELSNTMKVVFAAHGMLSLLMFVGLMLLYLISVFDHKSGHRTWFQRHVNGTWSFIVLWLISVGSGEAIFVWRYLAVF